MVEDGVSFEGERELVVVREKEEWKRRPSFINMRYIEVLPKFLPSTQWGSRAKGELDELRFSELRKARLTSNASHQNEQSSTKT